MTTIVHFFSYFFLATSCTNCDVVSAEMWTCIDAVLFAEDSACYGLDNFDPVSEEDTPRDVCMKTHCEDKYLAQQDCYQMEGCETDDYGDYSSSDDSNEANDLPVCVGDWENWHADTGLPCDAYAADQVTHQYCSIDKEFSSGLYAYQVCPHCLQCIEQKCYTVTTQSGHYDSEVSWTVSNMTDGKIVCGKTLNDPQKCCLNFMDQYFMECNDSYGDGWNGYEVYFDGVERCADFKSGHYQSDIFFGYDAASVSNNYGSDSAMGSVQVLPGDYYGSDGGDSSFGSDYFGSENGSMSVDMNDTSLATAQIDFDESEFAFRICFISFMFALIVGAVVYQVRYSNKYCYYSDEKIPLLIDEI